MLLSRKQVDSNDLPQGPVPTNTANIADLVDKEDEVAISKPYHDLSPFNRFYFVSSLNDLFRPSSLPQLAVFLPNKTGQPLDHTNIGILFAGNIGTDLNLQGVSSCSKLLRSSWMRRDRCPLLLDGHLQISLRRIHPQTVPTGQSNCLIAIAT